MANIFDQIDVAEPQENVFDALDAAQSKSEFGKGLSAGVDSLQGLGYGALGFIGDVVGSESLRNFGAQGMQRNAAEAAVNAPKIQSYKDVHDFGDFGNYLAYNTGQILPSVAESLGAAALGGMATGGPGAALGFVGKNLVKKTLQDKLSDQVKEKALRAAGATALNAYGTGVGDIYQSMSENGEKDPNAALAAAGAVPYAALEYLADVNLAKMVGIIDSGKEISQSLIRTSATKGLQQAGLEGVTEGGQQLVTSGAMELNDPASMTLDKAIDDSIEATMAAFTGSLIPGLGGGAIHHYQNRAEQPAPAPVAEEQPVEDLQAGQTNDYNEAHLRYARTEGATPASDYIKAFNTELSGITANYPDADASEVEHSFNRYKMDVTNDPNAPYTDTRSYRDIVPAEEATEAPPQYPVHIPVNDKKQYVGMTALGVEGATDIKLSAIKKHNGKLVEGAIRFTNPADAAAFAHEQGLTADAVQGGSGANAGQAQNIVANSQPIGNGDFAYTNPTSGLKFIISGDRFAAIKAEADNQTDASGVVTAARTEFANRGITAQQKKATEEQAKAAKAEAQAAAKDAGPAHDAGTLAAIAAVTTADPTFAEDAKKADRIGRHVANYAKQHPDIQEQNNHIEAKFKKEDERKVAYAARDAYIQARDNHMATRSQQRKASQNEKAPAAKQEKAPAAKPEETAAGQETQPTAQQEPDAAGDGQPVSEPEGLKLETLPFERQVFDESAPGNKRKESGVSTVLDLGGRKLVVININGVKMPFYLSTGLGGKKDVASGKWYPIFGIDPNEGWLNKTSGKDINNYYGSPELRAAAEKLDAIYPGGAGLPAAELIGASGAGVAAINRGLGVTPVENQRPDTRDKLDANIADVIRRIEAGRSQTKQKKESGIKSDLKAAQKQAEAELAEKDALREERNQRKANEAKEKTKVLADHFEAMQNGVAVPLSDGRVEVRYNIGVQTFKRVFDSDAKLRSTLEDTAAILKEAGVRQTEGFLMPKTEQEILNKKRDEAVASVAAAKAIFPYLQEVEKPRAVTETIPVKDSEGNLIETQTVKTEGDLFAPLLDAVRVFIEADVGSKEFIDSLSLIVEVAEGKLTEKDVASSSEVKAAKSFVSDPNITKIPGFDQYMEDARDLADKRVGVSDALNTEQEKRAEVEKRTKEYVALMTPLEATAIAQREDTSVTGEILDRAKESVYDAAYTRAYAEVFHGQKEPTGEVVQKATTPEKEPGKVKEVSPDTFWADTVEKIKNGDKYTGLDNLIGQAAAEMKKLDTPFGKAANILLNGLLGSDALSGVKVVVSPNPKAKGNSSIATYDTDTDTITVWNNGAGFTPGIFTHEMVHAATAHKIFIAAGKGSGKKSQAMVQAYKALLSITNDYVAAYKGDKFVKRLESLAPHVAVAELVAEALANPTVQTRLQQLESPLDKAQRYTAKEYSAWNTFIDAVKQLLGLNTGKVRTALDELLIHLAPLIRTEKNVKDIAPAGLDAVTDAPGPNASMEAVNQTLDSVHSAVNRLSKSRTLKHSVFEKALGWMTLNNISRTWGHVFPWLDEYIKTKKTVAAMASELNHASSELDSEWKKWTTSQSGKRIANIKIDWDGQTNATVTYAQLAEAMQTAMTRYEIDPRLPIEKQKGYNEVKDMTAFLEDYNRVMAMYNELSKIPAGKDLLLKKLSMNEELHARLYEQQLRNVIFTYASEAEAAQAENDMLSIKDLENMILVSGLGGKEAAAVARQFKKQYESTRGPYFHIGRFGDFYVRYNAGSTTDANGKTVKGQEYFMRFETIEERDEAKNALIDQYGEENVKVGFMAKHIPELDDHSSVFIKNMMQRIEAKQGQGDLYTPEYIAGVKNLIRELHLQMLPETAPDRVYVRRRNVPGYKESEQHRAWAKRTVMANLQLARLSNLIPMQKHMEKMTAEVEALQSVQGKSEELSDKAQRAALILHEIKMRAASEVSSVDTPAWVTNLNQFAYTMFLAASPSYIILNALQPMQLAQPVIAARHGYVRTAQALAKSTVIGGKILTEMFKGNAMRPYIDLWEPIIVDGNPTSEFQRSEAAKRIGLTDLQAKFLQEMLNSGRIDITQAFEIGHTARQDDGPIRAKVAAMGIFSHYGEVLNRVAAGLTAFDLEAERTGLKNNKTSSSEIKYADAASYAARMIEDTQFDYSQMNLARQMGKSGFMGSTTPLAMGFQRYAAQLIELWVRTTDQAFVTKFSYIKNEAERKAAIKEARKTLMYLLTNTGMIAGTMGLPFATVIFAAASALAGDDDEPYDAKVAYRNWLAELFGEDAGEIIAKGGFRGAGFDISQRAGMQNLFPFSRLLEDRRRLADSMESFAMESWGPAFGGIMQFFTAYDMMKDGYPTMKVLESAMPNAFKGITKATQAYQNGYVLDSKGNKIPHEYDGLDVTYTALGLNPSEVAEQREKVYSYNTKEQLINRRKSALIRDVQLARENGDSGEIAAAWRAVDEFNAKNPEWRLTRQTVIQSERRRKRDFESAMNHPSQLPDSRKHADRVAEYAKY